MKKCILLLVIALQAIPLFASPSASGKNLITYDDFLIQVDEGNIESITFTSSSRPERIEGVLADGNNFIVVHNLLRHDESFKSKMTQAGVNIVEKPQSKAGLFGVLLSLFIPVLIWSGVNIIVIMWLIRGNRKLNTIIDRLILVLPTDCLSCGEVIQAGESTCSKCGWSYKRNSEQSPAGDVLKDAHEE